MKSTEKYKHTHIITIADINMWKIKLWICVEEVMIGHYLLLWHQVSPWWSLERCSLGWLWSCDQRQTVKGCGPKVIMNRGLPSRLWRKGGLWGNNTAVCACVRVCVCERERQKYLLSDVDTKSFLDPFGTIQRPSYANPCTIQHTRMGYHHPCNVSVHTHHMYPPNRSNLHHLGLEVSTDVVLERVQNNQPIAGKTQVHCVQESHGHIALLSQDSWASTETTLATKLA